MQEERKAPSSSAEPGERPKPKPVAFALSRLARRSHSEGELSDKMARAGYTAAEIGETLDYLRSRRYLDDASFARDFARAGSERKRWGPKRIEMRLRELHLEDGVIRAALAETFPEGEEGAAERALRSFLRRGSRRSGERLKARLYRHLLARGFAPDVVHRLVSTCNFAENGELKRTSGTREP